jgi:hypothetical protein
MVCYDEIKNSIIPIFEFVTTDHTFINVSTYLAKIRKVFEKYSRAKNRFVIAPVIVTDFSWTLISSVLDAFNNLTVNEYLNLCFEILLDRKDVNSIKTVIYLCAAHFIKLIIKKVKVAEPQLDDKVKREFVFAFSLLQNSTNLIEFENYFTHIIRVFNTQKFNELTKASLSFLRLSVKNRDPSDLSYISYDAYKSNEEEERIKNFELLLKMSVEENHNKKNIKRSSKFQVYFENLFHACNKIIVKYDSNSNKETNPFFSPNLVNLIINYLYVMPMWTGIMLYKKMSHLINYKSKKRTTNNPVENHFDFDKRKLLHKKSFVKPSEFIAPKYRFLLSKFIQNYLNDVNQERKLKKQITDEVEKWKNKKQFNRVKGFYYQNIAQLDFCCERSSNLKISYQQNESAESIQERAELNDVEIINPSHQNLKGN